MGILTPDFMFLLALLPQIFIVVLYVYPPKHSYYVFIVPSINTASVEAA